MWQEGSQAWEVVEGKRCIEKVFRMMKCVEKILGGRGVL